MEILSKIAAARPPRARRSILNGFFIIAGIALAAAVHIAKHLFRHSDPKYDVSLTKLLLLALPILLWLLSSGQLENFKLSSTELSDKDGYSSCIF